LVRLGKVSIAVKTFGVCDFSRLVWFLALMTATLSGRQKQIQKVFPCISRNSFPMQGRGTSIQRPFAASDKFRFCVIFAAMRQQHGSSIFFDKRDGTNCFVRAVQVIWTLARGGRGRLGAARLEIFPASSQSLAVSN